MSAPPPPNLARPADWIASLRNGLRAIFHSEEVDRDPRLKLICGTLLAYFHFTFFHWHQNAEPLSTLGNELFDYAPAAFAQNLRWLVVLDHFQTQTYLYALGMVAAFGVFALCWRRSSLLALVVLAALFVHKIYFYLCDYRLFANYHHFHLFFTLVFLVATDKLRCFRAALAVCYFLSAIVKLTPSWLLGEYFNSLPEKLPLLPKADGFVTAASVTLIVLEFLGPLCWLTRVAWLRRLSFGAFLLFHAYSGVIVGFWYTTLMLPLAGAAFLGFHEPLHAGFRLTRRHLPALTVLVVTLGSGLFHYLLPGDARLTAEGRYFGSFMFDANRSVRFEVEIQKGNKFWVVQVHRPFRHLAGDTTARIVGQYYQDGWLAETFAVTGPIRDDGQVIFNPRYFQRAGVRVFGDPYLYYHYGRELVRRYQPDRVALRLDAQLNGHPESVRLLDIDDFAALDPRYRPFARNEWILLPGPDSPRAYRWP